LKILYGNHGKALVVTYVHSQEEDIGPGTFEFDSDRGLGLAL